MPATLTPSVLFKCIEPMTCAPQYVDRITVSSYQDEHGVIAWVNVGGTATDSKGKRWRCTDSYPSVSRETIADVLLCMREELDFEFSVKRELITIRG